MYEEEDMSFDSLFNLCVEYVVNHLQLMASKNILLPYEICDALVEVYQQKGNIVDDEFIHIFRNPLKTPLKRINLRYWKFENQESFHILLCHQLIELNLGTCLVKPILGDEFLLPFINKIKNLSKFSCDQDVANSLFKAINYSLGTSNNLLKHLSVKSLNQVDMANIFMIVSPQKLTHLNLSKCKVIRNLDFLLEMPKLTSLTLHGINIKEMEFISIKLLHNLKQLNLSFPESTFMPLDLHLASLIENLQNLIYLDISGWNLFGNCK